MSPDKRDRMNALCAQIMVEKDQWKFTDLVEELNELLEDMRLEVPASQSVRIYASAPKGRDEG
jgi:hypothetical protein